MSAARRRLPLAWRVLAAIGLASVLLPLLAWALLRALLAPLPGEWTTQLRLGPVAFEAGVPSLVRLATSHWVAPHLDGLRLPTSAGTLELRWLREADALAIRCAPCTLRLRGLGDEPLDFASLEATVQRDFDLLQGTVEARAGASGGRGSSPAVRGSWQGELSPQKIRLALDVPMTPLADGYALFAAHIPELARARIDGRFALRARVTLPNGEVELQPRVEGFAVTGLGTGALAQAQSACTGPADARTRLDPEGLLARAVIAAEDQRFWQHAGYDLTELGAAFALNQQRGRIARGGSTLSQQLAKLLVTGAERTPSRKLRELLYAADMEGALGKARILTLYLENAPWGPGVCGAHAAARLYFGTPVRKLSGAQAVWLAALLHNPGMELDRWRERGQIDVVRASWVAGGVWGLSRHERARLAASLAQAPAWPAPAGSVR